MLSTLYLDLDIVLFSHVFWDISMTSLEGIHVHEEDSKELMYGVHMDISLFYLN